MSRDKNKIIFKKINLRNYIKCQTCLIVILVSVAIALFLAILIILVSIVLPRRRKIPKG
ncbi:MAG: hypothetical protein U5N58_13840 [Actinomycetota bacterium]|nr:hypothetical protein [Actinomycetota bacterium]